jgi:hypothetical protein
MSPEEILMMSIAPAQKTISDYGQGGIDLAKFQLANAMKQQGDQKDQQRALELLSAKLKGEKELADTNNAAALTRTKEQVQGYVDRMTTAEKNKFKDYFRNSGLVQGNGESDEDFIKRGNMAVANQANSLWKSIVANQQSANDLLSGEQNRLNSLAMSRAKAQFAQDLMAVDKKKAALLNSQSVEDVLKTIPADKRAPLEASWQSYLQQSQDQAMKEFSPTVLSRVGQIKQVLENLSRAHSRIVDNPSSAGAAPYLDFALPDTQKKETGFLQEASKGKKSTATVSAGPTSTATTSHRFIPAELQNPDVLTLIHAKNPDVLNSSLPAPQILANTAKQYDDDLRKAQGALSELGVKLGPNNEIVVPESITRQHPGGYVPYLGAGGVNTNPSTSVERLSPNERQRRFDLATEIIRGMSAAKSARDRLLAPPVAAQSQSQEDVFSLNDYE